MSYISSKFSIRQSQLMLKLFPIIKVFCVLKILLSVQYITVPIEVRIITICIQRENSQVQTSIILSKF